MALLDRFKANPAEGSGRMKASSQGGIATRAKFFEFIIDYKTLHDGVSPSMRDIAKQFAISTSVVSHHLNILEELGLIERPRGVSRVIRVIGGRWTYSPTELNDN